MLDRGPQFTAELMKELNRMLGIEIKLSTSFYPQIDEQWNKQIKNWNSILDSL